MLVWKSLTVESASESVPSEKRSHSCSQTRQTSHRGGRQMNSSSWFIADIMNRTVTSDTFETLMLSIDFCNFICFTKGECWSEKAWLLSVWRDMWRESDESYANRFYLVKPGETWNNTERSWEGWVVWRETCSETSAWVVLNRFILCE